MIRVETDSVRYACECKHGRGNDVGISLMLPTIKMQEINCDSAVLSVVAVTDDKMKVC